MSCRSYESFFYAILNVPKQKINVFTYFVFHLSKFLTNLSLWQSRRRFLGSAQWKQLTKGNPLLLYGNAGKMVTQSPPTRTCWWRSMLSHCTGTMKRILIYYIYQYKIKTQFFIRRPDKPSLWQLYMQNNKYKWFCSTANKHCIHPLSHWSQTRCFVRYGRYFIIIYFKQQESLDDAPDYRLTCRPTSYDNHRVTKQTNAR